MKNPQIVPSNVGQNIFRKQAVGQQPNLLNINKEIKSIIIEGINNVFEYFLYDKFSFMLVKNFSIIIQ